MTSNQLIRAAVAAGVLSVASVAANATVPTVPALPGSFLATQTPANGNGMLMVQAYDPLTGHSLTEWTGLNYNDFQPGNTNATPSGGLKLDFGTVGGSLWSSTFGSDTNAIDFVVTAANGQTSGSMSWLTTFVGTPPATVRNSAVTAAAQGQNTGINIAATGVCTGTNASGLNPCQTLATSDNGWTVVTSIGASASLPVGTNGTAGGTGVGFWQFTQSSTSGLGTSTQTQFKNATGNATWTLSAAGDLVYNVPGGSSVPLPAAAWLLGSGLLGLVGIGRRRSVAAA